MKRRRLGLIFSILVLALDFFERYYGSIFFLSVLRLILWISSLWLLFSAWSREKK